MTKTFISKVLLASLSCLVLSNCGGGAESNTRGAPVIQSATLNSGKEFGYYGDCVDSCFTEYGNHVSFYNSAEWSGDWAKIANGLSLALSTRKKIILSIPDGYALTVDCNSRITGFLAYLDSQNLLINIYAIYPKDEYNLNSKLTETQIRTANACVRNAIANFEGTKGKPLYGIYTCPDPWIALDDLDIIACDDYNIGDEMLTKYLPALKKYGKPIFLIAGGACDWNYNPYAMVVAANNDEQIIGVQGFLWGDNIWAPGKCGIKNSVTLPLYQHVLALQH